MFISTEIQSAANKIGMERAVEEVAKAGFDAFDFSMFDMARYDWQKGVAVFPSSPLNGPEYLSFARKLRRIGEDNGIFCNQSHAPFPTYCPEIRDFMRRALECTAEAGGKICVIHPCNDDTPEQNAEYYASLLPFAKSVGVKIATENMYDWDGTEDHASAAACSEEKSFLRHLELGNDPYLVACLDIGHAEMRGLGTTAPAMIQALGGHLQALHVHDNDRWHDSHQLPGTMDIDFDAVTAALKEIGYKGEFTLEADRYLTDAAPEEVPEKLKIMANTARKLAMKCE